MTRFLSLGRTLTLSIVCVVLFRRLSRVGPVVSAVLGLFLLPSGLPLPLGAAGAAGAAGGGTSGS